MEDIWDAVWEGDVDALARLVGKDPDLLEEKWGGDWITPLMAASHTRHVEVVRWLLDKGAAINAYSTDKCTALWYASHRGRPPVVKLLLERGADPTIATHLRSTPLIGASSCGHLEVVRLLLDHPSAKNYLNHRGRYGQTALWEACFMGHGGVVRALLESGADPAIAKNDGTTPMAIAKQIRGLGDTAEGRRECVAALEVRFSPSH
jgi:uncharacterized protein